MVGRRGKALMAGYVSDAVIRRLPGYYRHLRELEAQDVKHISSQQLGERMQLTPSQIRQDINCFGGFGRQGYGYTVTELKEHIGKILGLDRQHRMIVIGAGNMGSAVAQYPSFAREGFEVIAMFDVDPAKVGTRLGNIPIFPMEDLETYLGDHHVDVAVLSLPVGAAQKTLNRLAGRMELCAYGSASSRGNDCGQRSSERQPANPFLQNGAYGRCVKQQGNARFKRFPCIGNFGRRNAPCRNFPLGKLKQKMIRAAVMSAAPVLCARSSPGHGKTRAGNPWDGRKK